MNRKEHIFKNYFLKSKKDNKEDKNQEEIDNKPKLNNENNEEKKEKENADINNKKKKKKEKKNNNNKKDFDKRKVYEFFSETICKSCDIPFKEKIGIFIDDFNKLIIIKVRNKDEPFEMINYDLKCYPKVNPHNIEIIEEYKKIIKENYEETENGGGFNLYNGFNDNIKKKSSENTGNNDFGNFNIGNRCEVEFINGKINKKYKKK